MTSSPARYTVVFALFLLSMLMYIDRVCIASAKDQVSAALSLNDQQIGLVFSAFALGYAIAQVPGGWLADVAGPRIALASIVTAWSFFTGFTGMAWSLASLVVIRFLFGIAEAGAFPGSARAIVNWLPPQERGRANGVLFSGSRIGAALSFPMLAWMLHEFDWRPSFYILGAVGIFWAAAWLIWFRNHPTPRLPEPATLSPTRHMSFWRIFRSRPLVLAMVQYFASNFTFFLCLSWMLPWLRSEFQLDAATAARWAMVPLLVGATSQWFTGWLVDRLYRGSLRAWSRRLPAIVGFLLAIVSLLLLTRATSVPYAVACLTAATFGADMTISPSWVFCADLSGGRSGSISGSMNMLGNFGSFLSANAFPWLHAATGDASAYFLVAAALNLIAVICWWYMKPPELLRA